MRAPERRRQKIRCAIYTRKSSEEGLEQDFNSLDAQRESCEAYVVSQKHEAWVALPATYDDGGYSGGSMERPALKHLLDDVRAGGIDIVVVYKVDRLTRSLTDFARIVSVFDDAGMSFVSVTQAFNTTTSMGRLTLNVLLSFAQFEREVTGERIRDKILASKMKGLWMGGSAPIGYDPAGRTLSVNEAEAETVRIIYAEYLMLKSVDALKAELDRRGLRTKARPDKKQRMVGGTLFSRGHLYRILSNPIYIGKIAHKGETYDGQHPAIIDQKTFDEVQALLAANSHARLVKAYSKDPALLSGLLFDENGDRLVATHATKDGKRYRYYRSRRSEKSDQAASSKGGVSTDWRLPAAEIESAVIRTLVDLLGDHHRLAGLGQDRGLNVDQYRSLLERAELLKDQLQSADPTTKRGVILVLVKRAVLRTVDLELKLSAAGLLEPAPLPVTKSGETGEDGGGSDIVSVVKAFKATRRGRELRLVLDGDSLPVPEPDPVLLKAVAQAHRWWRDLLSRRFATLRELATAYSTDERYVASVVQLAFLPTDLTEQILRGTQASEVTLHRLLDRKVGHMPREAAKRTRLSQDGIPIPP